MSDRTPLTIAGETVPPGSHRPVVIPVTTGLNGADLNLWIHVVHGQSAGPRLVVVSGLHGSEWFCISALRDLVQSLDPRTMRGSLFVVPVANPLALGMRTRNTPDESDSPDMNRIIPGSHTWSSDLLARALARYALDGANAVLDVHVGPWGSAFCDVIIGRDYADPDIVAQAERLAIEFGSPIVRLADVVTSFPGPRSVIGYSGSVLRVPALGVEVGGAGFGPQLESKWKHAIIDGVKAVMGALGMIDDPPRVRPEQQLVYHHGHRVNPSRGGLLRTRVGAGALATAVSAGTVLADVLSPYTFQVLETLVAPVDGLLFYAARDHPVHPGDWAFGIAQTSDGHWVRNDDEETTSEG